MNTCTCFFFHSNAALAIGLGHLYLDESIVATGDAVEVLAVACALQFDSLITGCCNVMISNLATDTVCVYLEAATRVSMDRNQMFTK